MVVGCFLAPPQSSWIDFVSCTYMYLGCDHHVQIGSPRVSECICIATSDRFSLFHSILWIGKNHGIHYGIPNHGLPSQSTFVFMADLKLSTIWGRAFLRRQFHSPTSCGIIWVTRDKETSSVKKTDSSDIFTRWCPPVISWCINPLNYRYITYKP